MNRVRMAFMVSMKEPILQRTEQLGAQTISFISCSATATISAASAVAMPSPS